MSHRVDLRAFLIESNYIEGIEGVRDVEIAAAEKFLDLKKLNVIAVEKFVDVVQPGAILRRTGDLNVKVGFYIAPKGGSWIEKDLANLLHVASTSLTMSPWQTHITYENLHPFTDGNGRSGRMIWLWQMLQRARKVELGFLHTFYYQTLEGI
jgi:hypothetical protein